MPSFWLFCGRVSQPTISILCTRIERLTVTEVYPRIRLMMTLQEPHHQTACSPWVLHCQTAPPPIYLPCTLSWMRPLFATKNVAAHVVEKSPALSGVFLFSNGTIARAHPTASREHSVIVSCVSLSLGSRFAEIKNAAYTLSMELRNCLSLPTRFGDSN